MDQRFCKALLPWPPHTPCPQTQLCAPKSTEVKRSLELFLELKSIKNKWLEDPLGNDQSPLAPGAGVKWRHQFIAHFVIIEMVEEWVIRTEFVEVAEHIACDVTNDFVGQARTGDDSRVVAIA